MQSKVKLTKRQIKEDKFTTFMITSKTQFQENWQIYVIGVVIILTAIFAVVFYFNHESSLEQESAEKYARAVMDYRSGDNQIAILGFSQIIEEFGSTEFADQAAFFLGKLHLSSRNYAEAISSFETYLSDYEGIPLNRAAALGGIASAHEDQGNYAEAAAFFSRASEADHDGPQRPDYELAALRNYLEVGDPESAKARLAILEDEYNGSEQTNRAIIYMVEKGVN